MTAGLVILLFASTLNSGVANSPSQATALGAPGCGAENVRFNVSTDVEKQPLPAVEAGKALVVFVQDDGSFGSHPRPTTRFGIDGKWVGATHANSFFYAQVDPGEHHVCANWQNRVELFGTPRSTAATSFTAESGKVYYIRARDMGLTDRSGAFLAQPEVELESINADEGQVLMHSFAFSAFRMKK